MAHGHFAECIDACKECELACEHCADACLGEEDVAALAKCIQLNHDCAELCRLAVLLMARDSHFAVAACELCATVCDACAAECEHHELEHCRECGAACRRCADECRRMARSVTGVPETTSAAHA